MAAVLCWNSLLLELSVVGINCWCYLLELIVLIVVGINWCYLLELPSGYLT